MQAGHISTTQTTVPAVLAQETINEAQGEPDTRTPTRRVNSLADTCRRVKRETRCQLQSTRCSMLIMSATYVWLILSQILVRSICRRLAIKRNINFLFFTGYASPNFKRLRYAWVLSSPMFTGEFCATLLTYE